MELVFLLPVVFILFLVAVYHRSRKHAARQVEWDKNKDKYKYKGYRY